MPSARRGGARPWAGRRPEGADQRWRAAPRLRPQGSRPRRPRSRRSEPTPSGRPASGGRRTRRRAAGPRSTPPSTPGADRRCRRRRGATRVVRRRRQRRGRRGSGPLERRSPGRRHGRRHPARRIAQAGHIRRGIDRLAGRRGGLVDPLPHPAPGPARVGDQALEGVAIHWRLEHLRVGPAHRLGEAVRRGVDMGSQLPRGRSVASTIGSRRTACHPEPSGIAVHVSPSTRTTAVPPNARAASSSLPPTQNRCRSPAASGAWRMPSKRRAPPWRPPRRPARSCSATRPRHIGHCRQPPAIASTANASSSVAASTLGRSSPSGAGSGSVGTGATAAGGEGATWATGVGAGGGRGAASRPQTDRIPIAATATTRNATGTRGRRPPAGAASTTNGCSAGHRGAHPPRPGRSGPVGGYRRGTGRPSRPKAR